MIYLNNAATSWPKPPQVYEAVAAALASPPESPFRSTLPQEGSTAALLRQALGRLFNIGDWERIYFCSSATDAINRVLQGITWRDCHFSADSHNSVLRPLHNNFHTEAGGECSLVAVNHCSNVTGEIADVCEECKKAHGQGSVLMLDAAQSAGHIPIDVDGWGVDILVFTGHKGLFGPMGTGGYFVRRGIGLRPAQFGGTGRDSSVIKYGGDDEWEFEVGTQNTPALAGLKAGVDFVLGQGVETIQKRERKLSQWLIDELQAIPKVHIYAAGRQRGQGPVVSFNIKGIDPSDVGYILQNSYGVTVRTGLHCAPLAHQRIGTGKGGTVRVSLSCLNTRRELQTLVGAVGDISRSL